MAQGIRITIYDPDARLSRSLTIPNRSVVIGPGVDEVAQYVEAKLAERWPQVTRLSSRRHKRR